MTRKITIEIITALLALLFVYAAMSKLMNLHIFRIQLRSAPFFGNFSDLLAFSLPLAELTIVALLFLTKTRLVGLWVSFISMLFFTVYVALLLLSGRHLPCTCGGLIQKLSWPQHLIFNVMFSLIALVGIVLYRKVEGKDRGSIDYNFKITPNYH